MPFPPSLTLHGWQIFTAVIYSGTELPGDQWEPALPSSGGLPHSSRACPLACMSMDLLKGQEGLWPATHLRPV